MKINFDNYSYYPTFRSRPPEIKGFGCLSSEKKEKIIPLISLTKWSSKEGVKTSLEKIREATEGNPYLLDIAKEDMFQCEVTQQLLSPAHNFKNWINFCAKQNSICPVVQMPLHSRLREVVQQAKELEQEIGSVAFRITNIKEDPYKTISSLAGLNSPEKAIVFIDVGYIRSHPAEHAATAVRTINLIRTEFPEAIISVLSASFPPSVIPFCDSGGTSGSIAILERDLHQTIGGENVAIYGDYSSIYPIVNPKAMGRYVPRIDVALDDSWRFERRAGMDKSGLIDAAKAMIESVPEIKEEETWGAIQIQKVANGNIEGMGRLAYWKAVRVNLHLSKQIQLTGTLGEKTMYTDEDIEESLD